MFRKEECDSDIGPRNLNKSHRLWSLKLVTS